MALKSSVYLALDENCGFFLSHKIQAVKTLHISALQIYRVLLAHTNSQHFTKCKAILVVNRSQEKRITSELMKEETLCRANW